MGIADVDETTTLISSVEEQSYQSTSTDTSQAGDNRNDEENTLHSKPKPGDRADYAAASVATVVSILLLGSFRSLIC